MNYSIRQIFILIAFLIPASIMDIRNKEISAFSFLAGIILGIINSICFEEKDILMLITGMIPGIVLVLAYFLFRGSIGFGDCVAVLFVGSVLWIKYTLGALLYAFIIAAVFGLVMVAFKKMTGKSTMPFLPFLSLGVTICAIV